MLIGMSRFIICCSGLQYHCCWWLVESVIIQFSWFSYVIAQKSIQRATGVPPSAPQAASASATTMSRSSVRPSATSALLDLDLGAADSQNDLLKNVSQLLQQVQQVAAFDLAVWVSSIDMRGGGRDGDLITLLIYWQDKALHQLNNLSVCIALQRNPLKKLRDLPFHQLKHCELTFSAAESCWQVLIHSGCGHLVPFTFGKKQTSADLSNRFPVFL